MAAQYPDLDKLGQQPSPGAHPALLVAGREKDVGRVGDGDSDREDLAVRVVHHAGRALGVLVEAQRGGVAGKGHRAGRTRRGHSGPVLVLSGHACGPSRKLTTGTHSLRASPCHVTKVAASNGTHNKPLAASPIPPAATKPSTKAATAAPAEMQRAVESPSNSPRVDRRPKRTGAGLLVVGRTDDMD